MIAIFFSVTIAIIPQHFIDFQKTIHNSVCAHGVMVIVMGNGQGDTSSNPGRGSLYFT